MEADDYILARHEAGHCAAAILLGRRVTKVARYGMHGILKGHGVTDSVPRSDETPAERLIVLFAGLLWEPTHASGDVRTVERLRPVSGMQLVLDEATTRASAMLRTSAFRRVAWDVERALWSQPVLREEEDVLALT